jgi:hypothetical protein
MKYLKNRIVPPRRNISIEFFITPNPDEPEPNRCMMSSQKIEVGHTLKSKNAAAFLLFNPSGTGPGTSVPTI